MAGLLEKLGLTSRSRKAAAADEEFRSSDKENIVKNAPELGAQAGGEEQLRSAPSACEDEKLDGQAGAPVAEAAAEAADAKAGEDVGGATDSASCVPGALPGMLPLSSESSLPDNEVYLEALAHGRCTERIACQLFDALFSVHRLGDDWRARLGLASRYHDIGLVGGRRKHQRTSMRLVDTDPELVHDEKMRPYVALLARYHRKAVPSRKHARFAGLPRQQQKALCQCMVLLRMASALARAIDDCEAGLDLSAAIARRSVTIGIVADRPLCKARRKALRWKGLFEQYFERRLEIVAPDCEDDMPADEAARGKEQAEAAAPGAAEGCAAEAQAPCAGAAAPEAPAEGQCEAASGKHAGKSRKLRKPGKKPARAK